MALNNENETNNPAETSGFKEITFHNVDSDTNVVKGEYIRDGQTHTVYVLAVPESRLKNYSYDLGDNYSLSV